MNDRSLRNIIIGIGGKANGIMRQDGFNITAASEIMAILCLSNSISDLKEKLGNIFIGFTYTNQPVYARDLKAQNAMTILLKDAIQPNLVQTLEGNPAIIHGGPFANIAQGTNSILATKMGLSLGDYVVTEAGFGADLGAEKFMNIKCGYGKLKPSVVVIVATIRALRHHGGALSSELNTPSLGKIKKGFCNLEKHIENIKKFGINPVIAINHFVTDSDEEINELIKLCADLNVQAVLSKGWLLGGNGTQELAKAVIEEIEKTEINTFKPIYDWHSTVKQKIETIAKEIYGADGVDFSAKAEQDLKRIEKLGLSKLPICMAKTQKSFSDNESLIGRPAHFRITVREFEIAAGAGFLIPIIGNMMRMPGLPSIPASEGMDIDDNGIISGLS
jgi:formate--tetrahydrofolate ligase